MFGLADFYCGAVFSLIVCAAIDLCCAFLDNTAIENALKTFIKLIYFIFSDYSAQPKGWQVLRCEGFFCKGPIGRLTDANL